MHLVKGKSKRCKCTLIEKSCHCTRAIVVFNIFLYLRYWHQLTRMSLRCEFKERSEGNPPTSLQKWQKVQMHKSRFALLRTVQLPWRMWGHEVWWFSKRWRKAKRQEKKETRNTENKYMLERQRIFAGKDGKHQ